MTHNYILSADLTPDHAKRCAYVVDQMRIAVRALLDSVIDAPKLSDIPTCHRRQVTLTAIAQMVGVLAAETTAAEYVPAAVTSLVEDVTRGPHECETCHATGYVADGRCPVCNPGDV